jgi:hypothetical protein
MRIGLLKDNAEKIRGDSRLPSSPLFLAAGILHEAEIGGI